MKVEKYADFSEHIPLVKKLRGYGIDATIRIWEDSLSIIGLYEGKTSLRFEIFPEEYAYIIEGDSLFYNDHSPLANILAYGLSQKVVKGIRFDLNEDGYFIYSAVAKDVDTIISKIKMLDEAYYQSGRLILNIFNKLC
ncbi:MAG: hypothetical protein DRP08_06785 [Candidatus Aenigmatarchaeota archaeon]|nr:MAG: hypothetical protein DRP08_06785 [Candidatus Aenigmarchaeota archaeon]